MDSTEEYRAHKVRRGRRGPEPKSLDEIRSRRFSIRFTEDEFNAIKDRAGSDNPKVIAEFIRRSSLNKKLPMPPAPIPELNRDAWLYLARSASNLNQIAKRLNSGEELIEEGVLKAVDEFRLRLIGVSRDYNES